MDAFKLVSTFTPKGDQPKAIASLCRQLGEGRRHNVLLGGYRIRENLYHGPCGGRVQKPTLVIAPNKTLAGQLYHEFKQIFPENAVEYFVSYYDYYQPEAYLPASDTYIQKDSSINDMIDKPAPFGHPFGAFPPGPSSWWPASLVSSALALPRTIWE